MVLFAGFPKKGKHHEPLTHTNMQQRKQHLRYRNYAAAAANAAKAAPAIPQLCNSSGECRESSTCDTAIMQQRLCRCCAYPERKLRRIVCWLLILSAEI